MYRRLEPCIGVKSWLRRLFGQPYIKRSWRFAVYCLVNRCHHRARNCYCHNSSKSPLIEKMKLDGSSNSVNVCCKYREIRSTMRQQLDTAVMRHFADSKYPISLIIYRKSSALQPFCTVNVSFLLPWNYWIFSPSAITNNDDEILPYTDKIVGSLDAVNLNYHFMDINWAQAWQYLHWRMEASGKDFRVYTWRWDLVTHKQNANSQRV